MSIDGIVRRYGVFVLAPAVIAGLCAGSFLSVLGDSPGHVVRSTLMISWQALVFGLMVTWPFAAYAKWRGYVPGPESMAFTGAVLGAMFAVLTSQFWLTFAGATWGAWQSLATVWFTVLAFGVPVGVMSALAAWSMLTHRQG